MGYLNAFFFPWEKTNEVHWKAMQSEVDFNSQELDSSPGFTVTQDI